MARTQNRLRESDDRSGKDRLRESDDRSGKGCLRGRNDCSGKDCLQEDDYKNEIPEGEQKR